MINERFTLGKEYNIDGNYEECYVDNETGRTFNFADENCEYNFLKSINAIISHSSIENDELRKEIQKVKKEREHWAFIADCSTQVMNEDEKLKEDYLRIATNELKKWKEENDELKLNNEFVNLLASHRGEMVTFANSLIYDMGSNEMQELWSKFKDEMYEKWKKERGIE